MFPYVAIVTRSPSLIDILKKGDNSVTRKACFIFYKICMVLQHCTFQSGQARSPISPRANCSILSVSLYSQELDQGLAFRRCSINICHII